MSQSQLKLSDWADDTAHMVLSDAQAAGMDADDVVYALTLLYRRILAAYPDGAELRSVLARAEAAAPCPPEPAGA